VPGHLDSLRRIMEQNEFDFLKDDVRQLLAESKDGADRVRRIVQNLKDFSHVSEDEWQWTDLHKGLESTLTLVWNEIKYKAEVEKSYGELPEVFCVASQLNQVFMNLLVNAAQAIETRGKISIATGVIPAAPEQEAKVWIEIRDTGKGIPEEHLKRIFEPFFTTKPVGKGTGLGLSLAWGIVHKHRGSIEVHSVVGEGSSFRLVLPVNANPDTKEATT
jgi:signal transduction histidine kinase